ncbi:MAG: MoxR family ATPase [Polyangiaceae bacterium]|nr:MoxR family ATPase [Polyangiaceae bacterium]
MASPFVLDPDRLDRPDPARRAVYEAQRRPATLGNHEEAARYYQPDKPLVTAINAALVLGVPLLLTGEAGTGKTQVAYWLQHHLGLEGRLFPMYVQSTSVARDLLYTFDNVAYFHAANDRERKGPLNKEAFLRRRPLWLALDPPAPRAIVLIDEIDKAPRDFPNDLLHVLDQHEFEIPELDRKETFPRDVAPPVIVITSNSERKLPEPFLRRCIFHHIELTEDLVRRAVKARGAAFSALDEKTREAAIKRFLDLRGKALRKRPATAELLVWLILLAARGDRADAIERAPLADLPALGALIKDRDDYDALR